MIKNLQSLNPLFIRSQFQMKIYSLHARFFYNGVSIPYSSGLSFRFLGAYSAKRVQTLVSIPYSSGLSFRYVGDREQYDPSNKSQSLIHQVSVSDPLVNFGLDEWTHKSQSLIHQVSVSDVINRSIQHKQAKCLNPLFIRSQFQMVPFFQTINTDT